VRLKDRDDATPGKPLPGSRKRGDHLGRMVRIIINDRNPAMLTEKLKPAPNPRKRPESVSRLGGVSTERLYGCDGHRSIPRVVKSRNDQLDVDGITAGKRQCPSRAVF
jgi:hypothetical protein